MYMSNADIVKEYKEAKDRSAQVKILADQNCCSMEQIIGILVAGGIDHRCFSMLRRKQNQAAASAAEKVVKAEKKIPYKKPEIIPGPPHTVTLADAMAAIRAELDEINRQQYELDMRKGDLYKQLWDMLGEVG
jgi:hypothetical protein